MHWGWGGGGGGGGGFPFFMKHGNLKFHYWILTCSNQRKSR